MNPGLSMGAPGWFGLPGRRVWFLVWLGLSGAGLANAATVERWGAFELTLPGPSGGNPFVEVRWSARFTLGDASVDVPGFYDGEGVSSTDPWHHLLGIHNGTLLFNHTLPWITHASIQNGSAVEDAGRAVLYRDVYRKPVVFDEVKYEGDIPRRWGNLTPEEMVHRFWQGTVAGTYVGHGETYLSPDDVLWWSKGGVLKGASPARIAFLRRVLEEGPPEGVEPVDKWQHPEYGGRAPDYFLVYLGRNAPTAWPFRLPRFPDGPGQPAAEGLTFRAEILDTWNMTVEPVPGTFTLASLKDYLHPDREGRSIALPGRPYLALRIRRVP